VVLGATACIGVTFDANALVSVGRQVLSVHLYDRLILLFNSVAIVCEVDRALLCQWAIGVEWIHNCVGCACTSASTSCAVYRSRATRCQCGSQTSNSKCFCNARTHGNFLY